MINPFQANSQITFQSSLWKNIQTTRINNQIGLFTPIYLQISRINKDQWVQRIFRMSQCKILEPILIKTVIKFSLLAAVNLKILRVCLKVSVWVHSIQTNHLIKLKKWCLAKDCRSTFCKIEGGLFLRKKIWKNCKIHRFWLRTKHRISIKKRARFTIKVELNFNEILRAHN